MSVVDWYNGRSILVTGGTGFMGKVLLEKLLRAVPGLRAVYVIVREKRGIEPYTRVQEMIKLPVFQQLRENNPQILKKLIAIDGDLTADNLGISEENGKTLQSDVSVVFHMAATLRLEAGLRDAVKHNLIGTENTLKFCSKMKNLQVFLHLSTAFCHCDVEILEEKIYPPTKNPRDIINFVKWIDDRSLEMITPSVIKPHPNTYTFTKRLAETLVYEYREEFPIIILRPAIVTPVIKGPVPGWVDTLNGPVGVLTGAGKGVIRSMLVEGTNHAEIIPVDIAINAMIISTRHRAIQVAADTPVYNVSQSIIHPITWGEVLEKGRKIIQENPFDWPLWYPGGDIRTNKWTHYIIVYLFQILPAYFLDVIFMITIQKRFMVRVQNKISVGMHFLQYFTLREWKFDTNKLLSMFKQIREEDKNIFYISNLAYDVDEYVKNIILGTRMYCLKEDIASLPKARRYLKFLFVLDKISKCVIIFGIVWLLLSVSNIFQDYHGHYYKAV